MTNAGKKSADILNGYLATSDDTIKYKSEDLLEQAKQIQQLSQSTNLDCRNFPSGWRYRCNEYHAGIRNGAYQ